MPNTVEPNVGIVLNRYADGSYGDPVGKDDELAPLLRTTGTASETNHPSRSSMHSQSGSSMSVRITSISESTGTVLQIAGKLRSEDVGELEREASAVTGPLVLDVSNLASMDAAGAESLKALAHRGAELRGVSTYLELLLERNEPSL